MLLYKMVRISSPFVHINTVSIAAGELVDGAGGEAQHGCVGGGATALLGVIVHSPFLGP